MQVIKPGRKQGGWAKEFICSGRGNGNGGCGATLLVSEVDIYELFSFRSGKRCLFTTFCCPSCGIETDINRSANPLPRGKRPSFAEILAIKKRAGGIQVLRK